jgi:hypothetical protein
MQLKTKYLMPVLTAVLMAGLSTAAFAQESCSVASTPVSRDTATGLTEVAGDLTFTCVYGGTATQAATITVLYPGTTITDNTAYPAAAPIRVVNQTGFTGTITPTVTNTTTGGQVTLQIPAQTASGTFTLTGVLVSLAGVTAPLNVNVSASPGNGILITAGENIATVITNILPGLKDPKLTSTTSSGQVLSSGNVVTAGFSVDITENYQDMLRSSTQFNGGNGTTNGTQILLTFNNIPTGVTLGGCTATDINTLVAPPYAIATLSLSTTTLTSTTNTETLDFTSPVDPVNVDTIRFACTTTTIGSTTTIPFPGGSLPITMTATLAPTGTALTSTGTTQTTPTAGGQIPRYTSNMQPATPLVVINIVSAQTTMLIPYALTGSGGYDTGIALANTTTDPFGGKALGSAVATSGTVALSFYPQTGTSCTLTTATGSTTPASFTTSPISGLGVGLDASGNLKSGGTWVVLLSQLLGAAPAAAGCPAASTFTGYIFIVANSTNVHGSAFISNFSSFTSATNVLVLAPPATNLRSNPASGVETLGN